MGIEIKDLRIGNHVLCMGERYKVTRLTDMDLVDIDGTVVTTENIDPIPITEELLKELGFEKRGKRVGEYWEKYICDDFYANAKFNPKTRRCRLEIIDEDMLTNYGNFLCWYLHEMENFTFMTTKKELL